MGIHLPRVGVDSPSMPSHDPLDDWHEFPGCESGCVPDPTEARRVGCGVALLLPGVGADPLGKRDRAQQGYDLLRLQPPCVASPAPSPCWKTRSCSSPAAPCWRAIWKRPSGRPGHDQPSEAWLCYPGIKAIAVYRFAHELHLGQARVLAECWPRWPTLRQGSMFIQVQIGARCFIDHGTGVVIGETAKIGDGCRLYQQVTWAPDLCRPMPTESAPWFRAARIRHWKTTWWYTPGPPFWGNTVVGRGCVVGGSVF